MLVESEIVLVTTVTDPTLFHKYIDQGYLVKKKVIEDNWVLAASPSNPIDRTIKFENGIAFRGIPERFVITSEMEDEQNFLLSANCFAALAPELKHIKFSAVGINFNAFYGVENSAERIYDTLINKASDKFGASKAQAVIIYDESFCAIQSKASMHFSAGAFHVSESKTEGLLIRFNYHHEINSLSDARAVITAADKYLADAKKKLSSYEGVMELV